MQFATSANTNPVSPGKFKKTVSQESPQSVREFTKQIEVRDQTECKETFKAIKNAQTTEEKNAILDQALEYFMQKAAAEEKEYFGKLEQVSKTKEEVAGLAREKEVRANEKLRWARKTDSNKMEFVSLNPTFNTYKSALAKEVNTAYPFTAEQLKSGSFWLSNVNVADPNEAPFACAHYELQEDESAKKIEDRFSEVSVSTVAESLRDLVYSEQGEFETAVEGVCAWGEGLSTLEFTDENKETFESFWTPKGDGFFDTSLDEKRAAIANCWRYQPRTDVIAKDVMTKKQDLLFKQRQARGPLSDSAIRRRKLKMTYYFQKQYKKKSLSKKTIRLNQGILGECVKVLTREMMPAIVAKHLKYEEDFLNKWATRGEKHTSYFISSPRVTSFIFKSAKLKKLKDTQMLTWENERSERLRKARLRIYGEDKSAYPVIKKTEKDEREDVEALEYYEADNIDYSTDDKIFI